MLRFSDWRRAAGLVLVAMMVCLAMPAARAADETVKLPTILSVTGSAAFIGKEALESEQLIVALVNAQGGIRGKQVAVDLHDTTSNPATAVQLANQIISTKVAAIFGPTFTAECNAVAPLISSGPWVSCYSPGVHPKPGSFMISGGVGSDGMAAAIATFFRGKKWTNVAIIASTDASGQDFEENFDKVLAEPANSGLKLVEREHFAVSDLSVTAQMTRIKAANPQVVIVWTAGTGLGTALHGVHDVGLDTPIVAGNANMVRQQLSGYKGFTPKQLMFPGILGITPVAGESAAVKAAQKVYFGAYAHEGLKPDLPGALSWDPTYLALDAYKALGWNATSEQIRVWITSQRSWAGANGVYNFEKYPQRGIGADSCVIDLWNEKAHDFVAVSGPGGVTH